MRGCGEPRSHARDYPFTNCSPKWDLNVCHDSCLESSRSPPSSSHGAEENWTSRWTASCTGSVFLGQSGGVLSQAQLGVPPALMASGSQLPAPHPTWQLLAFCCRASPLQGRRCVPASAPLLRVMRYARGCRLGAWGCCGVRSAPACDEARPRMPPRSLGLLSAVCCSVLMSSVIGSRPFPLFSVFFLPVYGIKYKNSSHSCFKAS